MEQIEIDSIIRSKRKTFSLEVSNDARLTVRAPYRATLDEIKNLINRKRCWILKTKQRVIEREQNNRPKMFREGEKFLFLGRTYPLYILPGGRRSLVFRDNRFILSDQKTGGAKELFVEWYRRQARITIEQKAQAYAQENGFQFLKVRITGAQKRWGSCNRTGNLNFSWRLVLAPEEIIDYVILHELSHLRHQNHSREFWKTVASLCPEYKKCRKWLKENGHRLSL
jgi:predicted metal-dependent hydrolase